MLTKYANFKVLSVESASGDLLTKPDPAAAFIKQAHRHEFDYERRPGYIYVRSRAISSRTNDNFDEFPAEEIKKAYATFVGKPVFVNHQNANHRRSRGVIIAAALHEDTNPDGSPDTWAEVLMEVDALRFPRLAEAVINGDIARTSMGTDVSHSVCTACGNSARTPAEYCQHIPRMKGMKIRRVLAGGQTEEVLIAERCYGLGFFENSLLVEAPADPTAFVLGVDGDGISATAAKAIIEEQPAAPGVEVDRAPLAKSAGLFTDLLDAMKGGVDPRNQCSECHHEFRWNPTLHRFVCPQGHRTVPAMASLAAAEQISKVLAGLKACVPPAVMDVEHCGNPAKWSVIGGIYTDDWAALLCDHHLANASVLYHDNLIANPIEGTMANLQTVAYGETKAPAKVDTLRADRCPVCKDDEAFNGEKCSVCGHVEPPSMFRDPDLSKAQEMDLRQEKADEAGAVDPSIDPNALTGDGSISEESGNLECTNCGEVFGAEGEAAADADTTEQEPEAEAKPEQPGEPADADGQTPADDDDLSDLADKPDEDLVLEEEEPVEEPVEDGQVEEPAEAAEPEEGASDDLSDLPIAPNMTCPICGAGTLVPATPTDSPEQPDVEGGAVDMTEQQTAGQPSKQASTNESGQARSRIVAAIQNQQRVLDAQRAELATLRTAVREIVTAAGVQHLPKFASLMATAGDEKADTTTEQAKKPQATDDPESVGSAPAAANTGVTPAAVTDVNNTNVALPDTGLLTDLHDVTKPVGGTDSVVDKTHNEGEITSKAPNNDVMDPPGSSGWKSSAAHGTETDRFMASLRLARLQISAGLATGEDLSAAQAIFDGHASMAEITTEASTLERVASVKQASAPGPQHRHLVPQPAAPRPSFQQAPQQHVASGPVTDDEFMFGGPGSLEG